MSKSDALEVADRVHSAAIRLLRAVRVVDDETGLSAPKLSVLSVLVFGGAKSLKALAQAEQVTPATMSKLVSDLEDDGLVAKRVDKSDRRGVRIEATVRGRALFQDGRKRRLEFLRQRVAQLSAAERQRLGEAAELMLRVAARE